MKNDKFYCETCKEVVDYKGNPVQVSPEDDPEPVEMCNNCTEDDYKVIQYLLKVISNNRHHIPESDAEKLIRSKYL